jgi:hypothetical protein
MGGQYHLRGRKVPIMAMKVRRWKRDSWRNVL